MDVSRFDLNLLRALDALLEERNVTRAAARSFVTQQAMSGALQRLRAHFDDQLLTRVGRHMELTALARSLAMPVRETLLAAQGALDTRPAFDPADATGTCRIAMTDYGQFVLLPLLLRRLAKAAPQMDCVVEPFTRASFDRVERGDLDFCLAAHDNRLYGSAKPGPRVKSEPMFYDDFVCVVDDRRTGVGNQITLDEYRMLRHNSVAFGGEINTIVEGAWAMSGADIRVAITAPTFSALIFMLPGTSMVATAQRRLAVALAPALGLRVLKCPLHIPVLQENLMWHQRSEQDPRHVFWRRLIKEVCVDLNPDLLGHKPDLSFLRSNVIS